MVNERDTLQDWRDAAEGIRQLCEAPHWTAERRWKIAEQAAELSRKIREALAEL